MTALLAATFLLLPHQTIPVIWTGGDSKVTKPEIRLVTEPLEWMKLWVRHSGRPESNIKPHSRYEFHAEEHVPEVDFKSSAVVAIFMGKTQQVSGYSLLETKEDGDTLTIRVLPRYFSVITRPGKEVDWSRTPYGFFLVPRRFSRVRIEQGIMKDKREGVTGYNFLKEFELPGSGL